MSKRELRPCVVHRELAKRQEKTKSKPAALNSVLEKVDIIRRGHNPDKQDKKGKPSKIPKFEQDRKVSEVVTADLIKKGKFFRDGNLGYYLDTKTRQLVDISKKGLHLEIILGRYGLNPTEKIFNYVAADLYLHAMTKGIDTTVHHFAFIHVPDDGEPVLYIATEDNYIRRVTATARELVDNGIDGKLFVSSEYSAPRDIPEDSITDSGLFASLILNKVPFCTARLTRAECEFFLYCQVFVLLMREIVTDTRPIYALVGEKGSSKTTAIKALAQTLYGPTWDVTDVTHNVRDFDTVVTNQSYVCFDNADENIKWLNNKLAIIASGGKISRNQLYKTHQQVDYPIISMVSVTSRTPCFHRDDVVDRLVLLKTERLVVSDQEDFKSDVRKPVLDNHERLWGEIIYHCQAILKILKETEWRSIKVPGERLQEFARLTIIVAQALGCESVAYSAWEKMKLIQNEFVYEGEPLFEVLPNWVDENVGREVTAGELNGELTRIAKEMGITWPYTGGHSIGHKLSHLKSVIGETYEFTDRRCPARNQTVYRFDRKQSPESKSIPGRFREDSGSCNPYQ